MHNLYCVRLNYDILSESLYSVCIIIILCLYSGEQTTDRKKVTSRKRRRNMNAEIDELASLVSLPWTTPQPSSVANPVCSLVPSCGNAPSCMDRNTVLRLTTTFLKLQGFMKNGELISCDIKHTQM